MKYWKKNNVCGTMENTGFVPNAEEVSQSEYVAYVATLPVPTPKIDYKKEWKKCTNQTQKLNLIAEHLGIKEITETIDEKLS